MIHVVRARGTGEGYEPQFLNHITDPLPRDRFVVSDAVFDAEVGPVGNGLRGAALITSAARCAEAVAVAVAASPHWNVVVMGYSLGALGVSLYVDDWCQRLDYTAGQEIVGVLPCANPLRRPGPGLDGYGIAGMHDEWDRMTIHHEPIASRHLEIANQRDGIPCCPHDSPLRSLKDIAAILTLDLDREALAQWGTLLAIEAWQLSRVDWRRYTLLQHAQRHLFAASQLWGFLDGSAHVDDYVANGLMSWGTAWLLDLPTDW